jgi:5-methyltetrahydrofolate--homocysteine methyltransferase
MSDVAAIAQSVMEGKVNKIEELIQASLDSGASVNDVLFDGLVSGMTIIGDRFNKEEIYLPEVLFSARAMKAGMEFLEPLMVGAEVTSLGKVVVGTVKSDIHDIGKNFVGVMLKGSGFEVIDLGIDVAPEGFVAAVEEHQASLIAMSALLSTTVPFMKTTIEVLEEAGMKGKVKTMVGGALVTQSYADSIGADGYAPNAPLAAEKAKELLGLT